jgi:hypothetical protein
MRRSLALEAFYEETAEGEAVQDPEKTETVAAPTDADPVPPVQNDTPPADEAELVPPVEEEDVSLESLVTALGMAIEEMVEIGANLREAERAIQTSDALDDLAHIAKSIDSATPAQAAMVETIGDMAVAGTDVEPEAVVPSLEQYVGRSMALEAEGIKERAKKIWEAIVAFVARIWEKIRQFWRGLQTKFYLSQLDKLEKEVGALGGHRLDGDIKTTQAVVEIGAGDVADICSKVFVNYTKYTKKRGDAILKAIEEFDPKNPSDSLNKLRTNLGGIDEGVNHGRVIKFPGGYELTAEYVKVEHDADTTDVLERLRNATSSFKRGSGAAPNLSDPESLTSIPSDGLKKVFDEMRQLVNDVAHFSEKEFKELDTLGQRIKSATDALVKRAADHPEETKEFQALANLYKSFALWVHQPLAPMGAYALKLVAAGISGVRMIVRDVERTKDKEGDKSAADKMNEHVDRDNEARMKQAKKFTETGKM